MGLRGSSSAPNRLPYAAPYGARVTYVSATVLAIALGAFRDTTDLYDIRPAAASVAITTEGIAGLDQWTASFTATTAGTATFDITASIHNQTQMVATRKTLTGTIASVGTAVTGTGTKFLDELRINDVLISSDMGAARVTAIASDTACTLVAAFPGGNTTGLACYSYENLTIWADTAQAGNKRRVNTITPAGATIVVSSALTGSGALKVVKVGVEVASCWFHPFALRGTTGHGYAISTQRTKPYPITGYSSAWRRVPRAVRNNSAGDFVPFDAEASLVGGIVRWPAAAAGNHRPLAAGTATAYTAVDASVAVPPTAKIAFMRPFVLGGAGPVSSASLRGLGASGSADAGVNAITNEITEATFPMALPAQGFEYKLDTGGSTSGLYVDVYGYVEDFE